MKMNCRALSSNDIRVEKSNCLKGGVYLGSHDATDGRHIGSHFKVDDAREFALEILRLCDGDAQAIDRLTTPKEAPKETKAIVVRKDAGGTLEYIDTAESVTDATGKAERFASYNNSASFIVFTPVAEAKATTTVALNHTPTL